MLPNPKPSKGKSRYPRWVMKDGTKVRIEDMSNLHITHSINMLERGARFAFPSIVSNMWSAGAYLQGEMACMEAESLMEALEEDGWGSMLPSAYYDLCKELERRGVSVEHKQY